MFKNLQLLVLDRIRLNKILEKKIMFFKNK